MFRLKLTLKWTRWLASRPETGMGYQRVTIFLNDGSVIGDLLVFNAHELQLPVKYKNVDVRNIERIEVTA